MNPVTNFIRTVAAFAVVVLSSSAAMAQETAAAATTPLINLTGAFGAGLVTIGAAAGIARLAASAVESMARQPEVAGTIQTAMIIAAALIEGFTFFALYICMIG
jgi:F-type H+-transporting ATPase subunit c